MSTSETRPHGPGHMVRRANPTSHAIQISACMSLMIPTWRINASMRAVSDPWCHLEAPTTGCLEVHCSPCHRNRSAGQYL